MITAPDVFAGGPRRIASLSAVMQELGSRLFQAGRLTRNQIEEAAARAGLLGRPLDQLLIEEQLLPEETVLAELSTITGVPFVPISAFEIRRDLVAMVPARTALHYGIIPLDLRNGVLALATSRLYDLGEQENIETLLRSGVSWVLCTRRDVEEAVKHFYGLGADVLEEMLPGAARTAAPPTAETTAAADSAGPGLTRLVEQIIREAIQMHASDIHLEPMEKRLSLRYRVDGVLCPIPLPEGLHRLQRGIVSCLKVMAQLNISEHRLPHDGRIRMTVGDEPFDIRVSVIPTQFGEAVNLRILNRKAAFLDLGDLGLRPDQMRRMEDLIALSHGIILITGPTGSGKTSTLYAVLRRIRDETISIITIEDPVEYQMDGILQIQAHPEIGLDFAAGLRVILRHDPNVIMIGEIRDTETADIAIRSSLTGHLVFSTLHTNDAAGAVARLVDMGIEPYLVASGLEGIVAQRLVRVICSACAEPAVVPDTLLREIERDLSEWTGPRHLRRGRGCPACKYTGYRGRRAIFELLPITDTIRSLVIRGAVGDEVRAAAIGQGMMTLRQSGWALALEGTTTADEVLRVTQRRRA